MQPVVAEAPAAQAEPSSAEAAAPPVRAVPPESAAPSGAPAAAAPAPAVTSAGSCSSCGAPLASGQNWCLECGSAAPGRLGRRTSWRLAGSVVGLTLLLASGAVAATYAALSSSSHRSVSHQPQVAQVAPVVPTPTLPATASTPVTPRRHRHLISRKPRLHIPKPKSLKPTPPSLLPKTPKVTVPKAANPVPAGNPVGTGRKQIVLDTNAASTYNPYAFPVTRYGDPSLATDADPTTAWTAQADANGRIDSGLVIDLKAPHKVGFLRIQGTRGLSIQIYGTQGQAPASITDPAWVHVGSASLTKRQVRATLTTGGQRLQSIALWIAAAPPSVSTIKIAEVAAFR